MNTKTNLKVLGSVKEQDRASYQYDYEQMGDVADCLYFTESILDIISSVDTESLKKGGSISNIAAHAREKISKALEILQP